MSIFMLINIALVAYFIFRVYRDARNWPEYIAIVPIISFMNYMRWYGMDEQAWRGAFIFAGFAAIAVYAVQLRYKVEIDRLMLGLNSFLLIGALGFLFNNEVILQWYSSSKGGPLFVCTAAVGLLTTLFTKRGFIGLQSVDKQAIKYGSFLLLAATFVALIWSIQSNDQGIIWAVAAPFILLRLIRLQLIKQCC